MNVPVAYRHSLEIVDDRGNSSIQPFISKQKKNLQNKSEDLINFDLDTSNIQDGCYIIRTKMAFAGSEGILGNAQAVAYLEVIDSKKSIISEKEFRENSLSNVAMIDLKKAGE